MKISNFQFPIYSKDSIMQFSNLEHWFIENLLKTCLPVGKVKTCDLKINEEQNSA